MSWSINKYDWSHRDLGVGTTRISQRVQTLPPRETGEEFEIYHSLGNFRGIKLSCDHFSRVKFSFPGPSTKIYHGIHRENLSCTKTRWMSTEELCVFVAITFIVKSGRQLLDKM